MSGGKENRFVIDTNVIFMALYNRDSKAGRVIKPANKGKIELFSLDSVREEIFRVLKRELNFSNEEIKIILEGLPIEWVDRRAYENVLSEVKVKHKPDKPVEALSLILNCGILSADTDFKDRVNVNELLEKLGE